MPRRVGHNSEESRYEIYLDEKLAGFAKYRVKAGRVEAGKDSGQEVWVFDSTEVDPDKRGQGLASTLLDETFVDVRSKGVKVKAVCPFVVAWFESNPDYRDLLEDQ